MIPENIRTTIFKKFFDENDQPIQTQSQYHREDMWTHINAVYDHYKEIMPRFEHLFTPEEKKIAKWGVLLHDVAKPDTIIEKERKICTSCLRPNVPRWEAKKVKECFCCKSEDMTITSDEWQTCNDCGKHNRRFLDAKENTHCYMCGAELPEETTTQIGWHGHDKVGGSMEFLAPHLEQIGLTGNEDVVRLVRCHSICHALLHRESQSRRAEAESKKHSPIHKENFVAEFGFDPFSRDFEHAMLGLYSSPRIAQIAVILSAADDLGKTNDLGEEHFPAEFIDEMVERLDKKNSDNK